MGQDGDFNEHTDVGEGGSPFSADLKGEFTSNFGTNTNAVSQIFKDGGFVGENKTRLIALIGVLVLVIVGALVYLSTSDDFGDEEFIVSEDEDGEGEDADDEDDEDEDEDELGEEDFDDEDVDEDDEVELADAADSAIDSIKDEVEEALEGSEDSFEEESSYPTATVAPTLAGPQDGSVRAYDETASPPEFSWEGDGGGWILFARDPAMSSVEIRRRVSGNSHRIRKLYPGTWYWQVRNDAGQSGIRSVVIRDPLRREIALSSPAGGGGLSGSGGVVSWTGDQKVSYYRVEISSGGWANPMYRFATSGTELQVQGVAAGQYQLRVGGFSEVSGKWEYSPVIDVNIQ